eukprot:scaffold41215_cov57-Phaeocystis_antarctica.AAC.2
MAIGSAPRKKAGPISRPARSKRLIGRGWPKLGGSLRHALALTEACGEPAGRSLGPLVFRHG